MVVPTLRGGASVPQPINEAIRAIDPTATPTVVLAFVCIRCPYPGFVQFKPGIITAWTLTTRRTIRGGTSRPATKPSPNGSTGTGPASCRSCGLCRQVCSSLPVYY
ncbi:Uncharacterised protein [Mycobacteroides abscessus subsp. abscessus]|nr:Uncharacterised protein [Mycobacteroides abscessus subsp. abscessus]